MGTFVERYAKLYETLGFPHLVSGGNLFTFVNPYTLAPWGPAKWCFMLELAAAAELLSSSKARMLRCTGGFAANTCDQWYAVIADRFTSLDQMKAKGRSEINRGLRNCQVRRIDSDYVADHAYEVYAAAVKSYPNFPERVRTREEFSRHARANRDFEDIGHYWGVFEGSTSRLIAYALNHVFDKVEVSYASIKIHPDYLGLYPSYALLHTMNEFYLSQQSFEYVNDGWRSVFHDTQIQHFLIRKFAFRREPSSLKIFYRGGCRR